MLFVCFVCLDRGEVGRLPINVRKVVLDFLALKLEEVMCNVTWILIIELRSSKSAAYFLLNGLPFFPPQERVSL